MVDEKQLRDIIQQVLGEMDVTKDSQGKVGVQQAVPRTKDVKRTRGGRKHTGCVGSRYPQTVSGRTPAKP